MGRKITEPRGGKLPAPDYHKLLSKVVCMLDTMCWEWVSPATHRFGYGKIGIANHKNKTMLAHRYAYQLYNGFLQPNDVVMHLCDNAKCCNPAHLMKGTQSQNIKDMFNKKRDKQRLARRKLTDAQVAQLRARYVPRQVTHAMLAEELGVHTSVVARAVKGTTYAAEIN